MITSHCLKVMLLLLGLVAAAANADTQRFGGDFSLTDQNGKPFDLQQLRGKVVVLFFGYTFCPDVCPTELSHVSMVLNKLDGDADRIQGLFVTVDPKRDTAAVLKKYLGYFHKSLIGLTGSQQEIEAVARMYRVKYRRHGEQEGNYSMDHSANLYVIDQRGEVATVVPYGFPAQHVLRVVQSLLGAEER